VSVSILVRARFEIADKDEVVDEFRAIDA
jgi:hypothetical protein